MVLTDVDTFYNDIIVGYNSKFSLSSGEWGNFLQFDGSNDFHIKIMLDFSADAVMQSEMIAFLNSRLKYNYGFIFEHDKATTVLHYFDGNNFEVLYDCENVGLWSKEISGNNNFVKYKTEKLRMVYEINLLNINHLSNIIVDGYKLKEWILINKDNGILLPMENNMWLWRIKQNELSRINNILGRHGCLVSWQEAESVKNKKKLP